MISNPVYQSQRPATTCSCSSTATMVTTWNQWVRWCHTHADIVCTDVHNTHTLHALPTCTTHHTHTHTPHTHTHTHTTDMHNASRILPTTYIHIQTYVCMCMLTLPFPSLQCSSTPVLATSALSKNACCTPAAKTQ